MHYVNQLQKSIPDKLKADKQRFLLWRKDTKRGKVPLGAMLTCIDPTDKNKCLPFNAVCKIAYKHHFDGISRGIGIANSGDMIFIDFDNVIDADGSLAPYVQNIIKEIDSYTEISPSGRGIHILAKGSFNLPAVKTDQIELYFKDRYFTLTGNIYGNHTEVNAVSESLITKLLKQFRPQVQDNTPVVVESEANTEGFSEIDIDVIINDLKADSEAAKLFSGDLSKFNGDHSSADLALCSHIIHYAKTSNVNLIDAVFRSSALMRDKWEQRADYRTRTIERALRRIEIKNDSASLNIDNFEMSDSWAGKVFAVLNSDSVKYDSSQKQWLCWNDSIWEPLSFEKMLIKAECVPDYIRKSLIPDERDKDILKTYFRGICRFGNTQASSNFLKKAAGRLEVDKTELDAKPELFACENGVFDTKEMKFRNARKDDLITKQIPVKYTPDAECPEFLKFLDFVTCGDDGLKRHLRQFFGLSLTGKTVQKMFFWYGSGGNGKSILYNVLQSLIGSYAEKIPAEVLAEKSFNSGGDGPSENIASLAGKRLVSSSELPENMKLNQVLVKNVTGNDSITARVCRGHKFTFTPEFKLLLIGNHKPTIKSQDYAIWRRIYLVPFNNQVKPENERDPDELLASLTKELSGILNWSIEGYKDFKENGLFTPEAVKENVSQYKSDQDQLKDFFDSVCLQVPGTKSLATEIFQAYQNYGGFASKRDFFEMLRVRGYKVKRGHSNKFYVHDLFVVDPENLL